MPSIVVMLLAVGAPPKVDFAREVAPIFADSCVSCHNPKAKKGGYDLSTLAAALKPGESGDAIIPGKPGESPLLEMIDGTTEPTMPKFAPLLIPEKRDVIRRWIAAGCPCPETDRHRSVRELAGKPEAPASPSTPIHAASPIVATAFHPTKPLLVVPGIRTVSIIDPIKRERVGGWTTEIDRVYSVRFSKDGRRLLIAGGTPGVVGVVEVWDVDQRSRIRRFVELADLVHSASYSPDESLIAASAADRGLYVWEAETGKRLHRVENHAESAFAAQFLADGRRIMTASRDKTVKLWDRQQQDVSATFANHADAVFAAAPSPDGGIVCTGGADGNIKYWKSSGEGKEKPVHFAHAGGVYAIVYSPDGKLVATAGADKAVKLWKASGNLEKTMNGHADWIYSLAFSPDGRRLASGSWDGELRVWEVPSGKSLSNFKPHELHTAKP
jgi:mono/diheme cytochrome c family protein